MLVMNNKRIMGKSSLITSSIERKKKYPEIIFREDFPHYWFSSSSHASFCLSTTSARAGEILYFCCSTTCICDDLKWIKNETKLHVCINDEKIFSFHPSFGFFPPRSWILNKLSLLINMRLEFDVLHTVIFLTTMKFY